MQQIKTIILTTMLTISGNVLADLNIGLIAHWSFDGNTQDSSVNHLDGVSYGITNYVTGVSGQAIKFDGVSTYINASNSILFNVNYHSIIAWVNVSDYGNNNIIIGKVKPSVYETIEFQLYNKYLRTLFATGNEANHNIIGSKVITENKWHQVAMTYNGRYVLFYVDGILTDKNQRTGKVRTNTNDLAIGRHGGDVNQLGDPSFFKGLIDEVSIYNRPLSAMEIKSLYQLIIPPVVKGSVGWINTPYNVTCQNNTNNTQVVINNSKSMQYDCEKSGLVIKSGDSVKVTIEGIKQ